MQQLNQDPELNAATGKWEYRAGAKVLLVFGHVGQGYFTAAGEPLGPRWDDARDKAKAMAAERLKRMILEER